MSQAIKRSVLGLMIGGFAWASGCGSSDDDDSGADTTAATANTGSGGNGTSDGSLGNTGTSNGNTQNGNTGTGTSGDVLMHDDSACQDQNPVDGEDCDTEGLFCRDEDGRDCACGQFTPGEWTCLEFGTGPGEGGQGGQGGEGGAG